MVSASNNKCVTILLGNNNLDDLQRVSNIRNASNGEQSTLQVSTKESLSTSLQSYPSSSLQSIHIILSSSDLSDLFDPLALAHLVPTLQSTNGTLSIQVITSNSNNPEPPNLQVINTAFLLAGLMPQSELKDIESGSRILTAMTKEEKKSTAASIRINKPKPVLIKASLNDLNGDDEDDDDLLIDEDDLLGDVGGGHSNSFLAPPPTIDMEQRKAALDDCGGRKACDDCTCGRADMEKQQQQSSASPTAVPTSSCGNCSKGDAFRCAGCPYLGKPAFKSGEEHLVLDLTDDL